jgi:hypothetical protein
MGVNRLIAAIMGAAILSGPGCATVEESSDRARQVAVGVGERVEYHAEKVKRKTRSLWQRIFGSGEEQAASRKAKPEPTSSATRLPTYPQQYVGKEN